MSGYNELFLNIIIFYLLYYALLTGQIPLNSGSTKLPERKKRKSTPLGFLDDGIFSPAAVRWWRGLDTRAGELCAEQFLISILKAAVTHNNQALHSASL